MSAEAQSTDASDDINPVIANAVVDQRWFNQRCEVVSAEFADRGWARATVAIRSVMGQETFRKLHDSELWEVANVLPRGDEIHVQLQENIEVGI